MSSVRAAAGRTVSAGDVVAELRRTYGADHDGFTVVLVGKDGTEKLRSASPVEARQVVGWLGMYVVLVAVSAAIEARGGDAGGGSRPGARHRGG